MAGIFNGIFSANSGFVFKKLKGIHERSPLAFFMNDQKSCTFQ